MIILALPQHPAGLQVHISHRYHQSLVGTVRGIVPYEIHAIRVPDPLSLCTEYIGTAPNSQFLPHMTARWTGYFDNNRQCQRHSYDI